MKKRVITGIFLAAVLIMLVGCCIYVSDYYPAEEMAMTAMGGNEEVTVSQMGNAVIFAPETAAAGFVFYPGGKVEHTAYAPLMLALAEQDILCVLMEMPLRLAVLDMDAAEGIPEQFPQVSRWYIGGHSLGGSMAASFVSQQLETYEGLVLLAAYSTEDLSGSELEVISLYGSEDGVLNMEKREANRPNLPEDTEEIVIAGGNHAQFGSYGAQEGDGEAAISNAEQIRITVDELIEFFEN